MKINRSKTGGRLIRAHIKVSGSSGGKIHITACLTHWFLQSHEPYLSCCCSLRPVCTQTSCRGKEHRWLSERKASILYRSHFFYFLWWIPRRTPCCCLVLQTEMWLSCFKLKLQVLFTSVFFFLYVSMRPDVNSSKNAIKCTMFQLSNFLFPFLDLPPSLPDNPEKAGMEFSKDTWNTGMGFYRSRAATCNVALSFTMVSNILTSHNIPIFGPLFLIRTPAEQLCMTNYP